MSAEQTASEGSAAFISARVGRPTAPFDPLPLTNCLNTAGKASRLLVDDTELLLRPLELAWAHEFVQKEIASRFQSGRHLLEQMPEIAHVMNGGDPEDNIV